MVSCTILLATLRAPSQIKTWLGCYLECSVVPKHLCDVNRNNSEGLEGTRTLLKQQWADGIPNST